MLVGSLAISKAGTMAAETAAKSADQKEVDLVDLTVAMWVYPSNTNLIPPRM